MKKLLLGLSVAFSLFTGQAQNVGSFLNPDILTLCVSNGFSATNLLSYGVLATTNVVGLQYTNSSGTLVTAGNGSIVNPFIDVPIPLRAGPIGPGFSATNSAELLPQQAAQYEFYVRLIGQSGANTATTFRFKPVYTTARGRFESTESGDIVQFTVTPNTTSYVSLHTNAIPAYLFPGATHFRCLSVTAGDTDASSRVSILDLCLTGR